MAANFANKTNMVRGRSYCFQQAILYVVENISNLIWQFQTEFTIFALATICVFLKLRDGLMQGFEFL